MEFLCKTIVVGDPGVGKTSLIHRYVNNMFRENYKATIGVDFALKVFKRKNIQVRMQLWDIAGQERFNAVTRAYCKDALGLIVVFDVARETTAENISSWKEKIDGYMESFYDTKEPLPALLIANKIDVAPSDWPAKKRQLQPLVSKHGFIGLFETSARESLGIDGAMNALVDDIIARKHHFAKKAANTVVLDKRNNREKEKDNCSC